MSRHIVFYLYAINGRGQSKVLIDIAVGLAGAGYQVTFCCARVDDSVFIDKYKNEIKLKVFGVTSRLSAALKLKNFIDKNNANVIVSGGTDNNCIVALVSRWSHSKPLSIITEHTSLIQTINNSKRKLAKLLPLAVRLFYPKATVLASVSCSLENELLEDIKVKHSNTKVLYNPVINDELQHKSLDSVKHKWFGSGNKVFIGVGQLTEQKDFFTLLNAFKLLKENTQFKLIILGDGPDKVALQKHIDALDIKDKVDLVGRVDNPYAYMKQADVFVLSSKWEGFGLVLVEAMACGTPVVSTDCPHGPREILADGKWGELVPVEDPAALAKAMLAAVAKPRDAALERAQVFSHEASIKQYAELIESLV